MSIRRSSTQTLRSGFADAWNLDSNVIFLNHGSFGACPSAVLARQNELRQRMESEPVRFFIRELPQLLDEARSTLAAFVNADASGLVFVKNATSGVNTALAAIPFDRGDEILVTDHGYQACRNAVHRRAEAAGAKVIETSIPLPLSSPETVTETVLASVTPRTRAAVIDHVTSPTGLVLPVIELAARLEDRGVIVIVDGAHAPGMVELDVEAVAAPFYTGNCHKWMCAPKGAAFLSVRDDWRERTHPLVTSHGAGPGADDRNRLHLEFDWIGTDDPSAWLSVPAAVECIGTMVDGGWPAVRERNRRLALEARAEICDVLGIEPPCPRSMIGSLAAVPLPADMSSKPAPANTVGPLQDRLYSEHRIEVPVTEWGQPPRQALRLSAHLYNSIDEYRYLADALRALQPPSEHQPDSEI